MTTLAVITRLQELHRTVAGVVSAPAPADYPSALQTAHLPTILTLPAEGTWNLEGIGTLNRADTPYRVYLYVSPVAQGAGVAEGMVAALEIFDALRALYLDPDTLQLITSGGVQATLKTSTSSPIRHSGLGVLTFGETAYRGFTVDLGVMEKW